MARPLRVQFSGALCYLTARGNERKPIFGDERDRPAQVRKYLSQCLSADAQPRSAWRSATAACALSVRGTSASPAATPPLISRTPFLPGHAKEKRMGPGAPALARSN
jgi:hypothetical protein